MSPPVPRRWLRLPRRTLRLRLTLLYGALFLVAGAILLAITYGLVAQSIDRPVSGKQLFISAAGPKSAAPVLPPGLPKSAVQKLTYQAQDGNGNLSFQVGASNSKLGPVAVETIRRLNASQQAKLFQIADNAKQQLAQQRDATMGTLLTRSAIALGIMAFISIGLGWLMAGRALRPVRLMAARARGISERNLHERLAVEGPDDELKELGETFDGLLGRLETAFESQRRFVANASHELRTPITVERTLVEVALADPEADVESLKATCERVLAAGEQQERLIEALLTLARSQRGLDARAELDLGSVALDVVRSAPWNGVQVQSSLGEARVAGDPALVERLIGNLVDNARLHNLSAGRVEVSTGIERGHPTLRVANTGPVIEPEQVPSLIEPFRRLNGERTEHRDGLGLGLSIVDAIARAHGASMRASARAEGGLEVEVRFPPVV